MLKRFTNKYHAKRTTIDGITFASKAEARRYVELKALQSVSGIYDLELQTPFILHVKGIKLGTYRADFVYFDSTGKRIVEDVKGFKTPLYNWKKKHVAAEYGIEIQEVR